MQQAHAEFWMLSKTRASKPDFIRLRRVKCLARCRKFRKRKPRHFIRAAPTPVLKFIHIGLPLITANHTEFLPAAESCLIMNLQGAVKLLSLVKSLVVWPT